MQKEHVKMLADLQKNLKRLESLENPFKPVQNLTKMFRKQSKIPVSSKTLAATTKANYQLSAAAVFNPRLQRSNKV